jgi:hypothetical protein
MPGKLATCGRNIKFGVHLDADLWVFSTQAVENITYD